MTKLLRALLGLASIALPFPCGAGALETALAGERALVHPPGGENQEPAIAIRKDGSFLVVWQLFDEVSPPGILARLFGPGGAPLGDVVRVDLDDPPLGARTPHVRALPNGGFVVVWVQWIETLSPRASLEIYARLLDRMGRPAGPVFQVGPPAPGMLEQGNPSIAMAADGRFLIAWTEITTPLGSIQMSVRARVFAADGTPAGPPLPLRKAQAAKEDWNPVAAPAADDGFLVLWTHGPLGSPVRALARRVSAQGGLAGPLYTALDDPVVTIRIAAAPSGDGYVLSTQQAPLGHQLYALDADGRATSGPAGLGFPALSYGVDLAFDAAGRLLAIGRDPNTGGIRGRLFDAALQALSEPFDLVPPAADPALSNHHPAIAGGIGGRFQLAWLADGEWFGLSTLPLPGSFDVFTQRFAVGCASPTTTLCLGDGRFRITVSWRDHQGNTGTGKAVPLTGDTGSFWFFTSTNLELLVKILDGRVSNGRYWVFYGALSNVEYDIRVEDTETGAVRTYHNPARRLASHADTRAFPAAGAPVVPAPAFRADEISVLPRPLHPPLPCRPADDVLCLDGGAIAVAVEVVDPRTGERRKARAVPLTDESGAFWFFDEKNLELTVKVLHGSNGHRWIFHGALTNVEYTITVVDLADGHAVWTYHNPRGRMHSGADTSPF